MTLPLACILVAWLLVWPPKLVSSHEQRKLPGGYDNRDPRVQRTGLSERGRRAQSAHENSLEVFPAFAAAVLVSHVTHANEELTTIGAVTFCVARAIYPWLYLGGWAAARSTAWTIGALATLLLFVSPWLT
jgi:uncharacterized MAPEG superfamily protein